MKTIWKFPLVPNGNNECSIRIPTKARILHVAAQADTLCLWAELEPIRPLEKRSFTIVPTGSEVPCSQFSDVRYIGSILMFGGTLVFHVYETGIEL